MEIMHMDRLSGNLNVNTEKQFVPIWADIIWPILFMAESSNDINSFLGMHNLWIIPADTRGGRSSVLFIKMTEVVKTEMNLYGVKLYCITYLCHILTYYIYNIQCYFSKQEILSCKLTNKLTNKLLSASHLSLLEST